MAEQPSGEINRTKLHLALIEAFSQAELRTLCYELAIDYDDLPPGGRSDKAWELIAYCGRTGRLPELLDRCREARPNKDWDVFLLWDPEAEPPFKGLRYFTQRDADIFFGRETLTAELVDYLGHNRFLAVVGASGSGKSSLVRAGLVPALTGRKSLEGADLPAGSADWPVHIITPTARPLEALAISLTRDSESVTAATTLMDDLAQDWRSLHFYARRLLESQPVDRLLLVVDQFEELFTLCRDEDARLAFLDNLLTAAGLEAGGPTGPVTVVLTLRADFYAHCARYPQLRAVLEEQQKYIGQMDTAELRQAIERPAENAGLMLEEGLVEVLLRDIGAEDAQPEPGALPLLSHALLESWKRREGRTMTLAGYRESGGVQGAIAHTAEGTYQALNPEEQAVARDIFLRLTELGEGRPDTRRRVSLDEIVPQDERAGQITALLAALADARLVTTDEGAAEVAHEALIQQWPRLRDWLDEDRESLRLRRQLTEAALEWQQGGQDAGYLYRGARLAAVEAWLPEHGSALNQTEQAFIVASLAERDRLAQEQEEQRRRKEQLEIEQRNARRFRRLTISAIGLFVIAVIAAGFAVINQGRAEESATLAQTREAEAVGAAEQASIARATAEAAQTEAEENAVEVLRLSQLIKADQLAAEAELVLERDPELALLLARAAAGTLKQSQGQGGDVQRTLYAALSAPYWTTLYGHEGPVNSVAYSLEGDQVATGGNDGTVRLWDATTGKEIAVLEGSRGGVFSVAYSPDGEQVAAGGRGGSGGTVRLWDAATGAEIAGLEGHGAVVYSVAYSPDGEQVATGGSDGTARLWDAATGEEIAVLEGHGDRVSSVAYSPGGEQVATGGSDGTVRLWDAATGAEIAVLEGHGDAATGVEITVVEGHGAMVLSVAYSPDGKQLATGGSDGTVRLWDAATGKEVAVLEGNGSVVQSVAYGPNGGQVATASLNGMVRLWDVATGEELAILAGHGDAVNSVAYSPDGGQVATASRDGTAQLWDTAAGEALIVLEGHGDRVSSVAYSPGGEQLATRSLDGTAQLWDTATGAEIAVLEGHGTVVHSVAYSPDGGQLATASQDGTARLWDAATGAAIAVLEGHGADVYSVAYSPDGGQLATGSYDGTARLWDAATGAAIAVLEGHGDAVNSVAYSPDGGQLATASQDGTARLWDAATGKEVAVLEGHWDRVISAVYSPDGQQVATGSYDGTARLWDAITGEEMAVLEWHGNAVNSVVYSLDGGQVATVSLNGMVRLWDAITGEEMAVLEGASVAYSPDGEQLTIGYVDGTVRLWDAVTVREMAVLEGHRNAVHSVAYSPDGGQLATGSYDGTARLWRIFTLGTGLIEANRRLQRGFSEEECQRYFADDLAACPREPY